MLMILTLHSIVRWLLILAAAAAIVRLAIGWFRAQPFDKSAQALTAAFGGLMDLQLLLGLMFFLWNGLAGAGFPRTRLEHLGLMLVAVVVAHLPSAWKKKADAIRYRNTLLAVLAALVLVVIGVSLLPGNRWLSITGLSW